MREARATRARTHRLSEKKWTRPENVPAAHVFPSTEKATAVTISGRSAAQRTFFSRIDQTRSLKSQQPVRKKRSSLGWNAIDETKSGCWKMVRQLARVGCQSRAVCEETKRR